jgi:hypothetical protein
MEKYLYLTRPEWQASWVHGGVIPINLASTYLRQDRSGIYTPDENLIYRSPVDLRALGIHVERGATIGSFSFKNCSIGGVPIPDFEDGTFRSEDGLILSFCNSASSDIAKRLGKTCCVKILDINALKDLISNQLGTQGKMGTCEYTHTHERNHFLKSAEDSWQNEFRIFWEGDKNVEVALPAGVAIPVKL